MEFYSTFPKNYSIETFPRQTHVNTTKKKVKFVLLRSDDRFFNYTDLKVDNYMTDLIHS